MSIFSKISMSNLRPFCTSTSLTPRKAIKVADVQKLKESWLASLTCTPLSPIENPISGSGLDPPRPSTKWVIGVDPDIYGALAVLQYEGDSACSAQVFDSPRLKLVVGGRVRNRLDANSVVQLLRSLEAPAGTTAYLEQSNPYPKDGKQGWWSGGFGYGLWIGILVASGFSVVPVPSLTWKNEFELTGPSSTKDDSRRIASELFPSLSSSLKRKKDHGRAEALLIAAYGKGLKMKSES
ncbi:hypothetical protein HS088_TW02G00641 [Tripterygium wilfordii]|uniref:Uncharacterized protein n=2 Tax=Tripterygium wilfordii TaxID=458696 RepID=A0A7J7DZX5_TRIWF|nr:hypothetical protein HS088_TW02G00641 [Tripterygium wilfordii]